MSNTETKYSDRDIIRMIGFLLEARPTTRVAARNASGSEVEPESAEACSFCLIGARRAVMSKLFGYVEGSGYDGRYDETDQRIDNLLGEILDSEDNCLLNSWEPLDADQVKVQRETVEKLKNYDPA